jgi:predicted porin
MRSKLMTMAVAGALAVPGGTALAQSGLVVFGVLDAYYSYEKNAAANSTRSFIDSGGLAGSRIGFRGTKSLSGGMGVDYRVEFGFSGDTGVGRAGDTSLADRAAWFEVHNRNTWGSLRVGRQFTNSFQLHEDGEVDMIQGGSTFATVFGVITSPTTRASNAARYFSPNFGGFVFSGLWSQRAATATQEDTTVGNKDNGQYLEASLRYAQRQFRANFLHGETKTKVAATADDFRRKDNALGAAFTFGPFQIAGIYDMNKTSGTVTTATAAINRRNVALSGQYSVGKHAFVLSWGARRDRLNGLRDINQIGAAYFYKAFPEGVVYAAYALVDNDALATGTLYSGRAVAAGFDPKGFQLGFKYTF